MDIEKYRKNSSFYKFKNTSSYNLEKDMLIDLASSEFKEYQKGSPNTFVVYHGSHNFLGTLIDVMDIESRTDTKWLLTDLNNKVELGDVITIEDKKWMCIYDKFKDTQNCYKVKIQPCNYLLQIPYLNSSNSPRIYYADTILFTFLTDVKDSRQPFPTDSGTTYVNIELNSITSKLKSGDRLWLYNRAFQIAGVDFTNANLYTNIGLLKLTCHPTQTNSDDDIELGICDYYKFFPSSTNVSVNTTFNVDKFEMSTRDINNISATNEKSYDFTFVGSGMGCVIDNVSNNSCTIKSGNSIGIINVKATNINNSDDFEIIRIIIN